MNWILDRIREPSTHAGLGIVVTAAAQLFPQYQMLILGIAGLFGVGSVVIAEHN